MYLSMLFGVYFRRLYHTWRLIRVEHKIYLIDMRDTIIITDQIARPVFILQIFRDFIANCVRGMKVYP